jgi:hypothetical protein
MSVAEPVEQQISIFFARVDPDRDEKTPIANDVAIAVPNRQVHAIARSKLACLAGVLDDLARPSMQAAEHNLVFAITLYHDSKIWHVGGNAKRDSGVWLLPRSADGCTPWLRAPRFSQ